MSDTPVEIVPKGENYPVVTNPGARLEIMQLIEENLGGRTLEPLTLPRIRVPSGGATDYRIEGAGGEHTVKSFEGIIVAHRLARIYWAKAYGSGGGTKPPDCTSIDGLMGIGNPGGPCSKCLFAKFGSASKPDGTPGRGQACKEITQALVLLPEEMLPHLLNIPPTSSRNFRDYAVSLTSKQTFYWATTTLFSLTPAQSADGIKFARAEFEKGQRFDADARQAFEPYHKRMKEFLTPSVIDGSVYEEDQNATSQTSRQASDDDVPF